MDKLLIRMPRELKAHLVENRAPRVPAGGSDLWGWFLDLSKTRSYHAAGPNPIGFAEIEAYARLHRLPIRPDHVAIIRAMDETYLDHVAEIRQRRQDGVKTLPPRSAAPMTGELFDAMFG